MDNPPFESIKAMKMFLIESAEQVADVLRVLGHPKRIEILSLLLDGDKSFKELMLLITLQRSALGNHLAQLVDKGLVEKLDRGTYRITVDGQALLESIAHRYLDTKLREQLQLERLQRENMRLFDKYTTLKSSNVVMTYRRKTKMVTKSRKTRLILDGLEKVSYLPREDGSYEFTPFPSCLKSCMAFLGDPYSYHYLMGTSGAAFRLIWHSKRWEGGNVDITCIAKDPTEPFRHALEAVGFAHEIILNEECNLFPDWMEHFSVKKESGDYLREKILESIHDRKTPVLGFGIIGPPECCIINGYDDSGDILTGWNFFQDLSLDKSGLEFESSGYFRRHNWIQNTVAIITLGDKQEKPPLSSTYRKTLDRAVKIIRTPMVRESHSGLAAYDIWAEKLQKEEEFPKHDMAVLAERKMVHYDAMTMVAERNSAAKFVRQVADHERGMKEDLYKAAACFEEEAKLMGKWWEIIGPIFEDEKAQIKKLADPDVRNKFASLILQAREKDEEAANHIDNALNK